MNPLVESLKRLYKNERINSDKIIALLKEKKITKEEYEYILN